MLCVDQYTNKYIKDRESKFKVHAKAFAALRVAANNDAALKAFEEHFFNNLLLALDAHFIHRARAVEKKDGNPLNEARMLCTSLTSNAGVLAPDKTIKYVPEKSVLKYQLGSTIALNEAAFRALCEAFFVEIKAKFR